ncbi:MAG: CBS domain-containing protein [Dichotomicrobium sp.]
MKVREAMHSGVEWMAPTASLPDIAARMREHDIGAVPIGENDRLIGMVTDRDMVVKALANGADISSLTARDVMTEGILYCRADEDLGDALHIMEEHKVRRLPVIDENKRMIGMLSMGDVSSASSHELAGELASAVSAHHA